MAQLEAATPDEHTKLLGKSETDTEWGDLNYSPPRSYSIQARDSKVEHASEAVLLEPQPPHGFYIPMRKVMATLSFLGLIIVYMQRVNLSVAIIPMAKEFDWDDSIKGLVLSSFFWGYITSQIPGGWLATRFGGKLVFGFGLAGSSLFTFLLPITAGNFYLLLACRVLTGVFEAVSFPTLHAVVANWYTTEETTQYLGFIYSGSYAGTVISMIVTGPIIKAYGWHFVFYIFGALGIVWFIFWMIFAASSVKESRFITQYEAFVIQTSLMKTKNMHGGSKGLTVPWRHIFTSAPVWAIIVNHFANNWGFYILLTWIPTYMEQELHFNTDNSGFVSFLPFLAMFFVTLIMGRVADFMIDSGVDKTHVRKGFQTCGTMLPSVFLGLLCFQFHSTALSVALMVCALGFAGMSVAGAGCNHLDIAPRYAGILLGISNTAATIPGIVGVSITGYILNATNHNWSVVFGVAIGVYSAAAVIWLLFASGKKVPFNEI
jgi:MFS family permease